MLFNSPEYLYLFLPLVLLVFVYLARTGTTEAQINWLLLASMVFYGSWNPWLILLVAASVVVNFLVGRRILMRDASMRKWLIAGVAFNLALLGYFKYLGFFVENLSALGLWLIPMPTVVLPLAISFFTFQQIAYLVDASRGECGEYRFRHYALFVMFFPQLIAGPIVHHREMMPQFARPRPREAMPTDFAVGLAMISIGLFKKVVLADSLARYTTPVYAAAGEGLALNSVDAWIAILGFSFQIYFDFSAYSDMAIGSARLFGIRLPENFRSPYKSASMIDLWQRWHMTLSRFLRDYLYIALGGNRHGTARRYRNLMITMLLGGLWHGAAWTFVLWGGLHGLYLCINHGWRALCSALGLQKINRSPLLTPFYVALTVLAWAAALVVFRAPDLAGAFAILQPGLLLLSMQPAPLLQIASSGSFPGQLLAAAGFEAFGYLPVYALLAVCAFVCWCLPNSQQYLRAFDPVLSTHQPEKDHPPLLLWQPTLLHAGMMVLLLGTGLLGLSAVQEFIYFQF